ncbi:hypothetical protein [Actinoplanes sp. NPDC049681]|uniref:hypothetical protein n=1 Tax=Actinoplanes sp. NPDC049681 TaxID=3363905 RepID=UPI00378FEF8A
MTRVPFRTLIPRILAVLLAAWIAFLALHPPTISAYTGNLTGLNGLVVEPYSTLSHQCPPPISYMFKKTDLSEEPDTLGLACRERAIGTGVTIGLLGTIVALLLGFARSPTGPACEAGLTTRAEP